MKLYWHGDVGWYNPDTGEGISVTMVKDQLDAAAGADLEIELTTFGGNFFEGVAILDLLRSYPGKKIGMGSSIVASAGTVISLGFDEFIVRPTTMFMIHNAQGFSMGDHNQLREDADLYQRMSDMIAAEYAKKTGKPLADIKAMMDGNSGDGTWLMGQEIVDNGFADSLQEDGARPATMALIMAQKQFNDRVTMWAKRKPVEMADQEMTASKRNAERLIASGDVDRDTAWSFSASDGDELLGPNGDDWSNYRLWHLVQDTEQPADTKQRFKYPYGKGGKVYRSALRSIASRASAQGLTDLSDWASAQIKKIDAGKEQSVKKEDVIAWLKDNPGVDIGELALAAGQSDKIMNKAAVEAVQLKATLDADKIADPVAVIAQLRGELASVESDRVNNIMDATFGPAKLSTGAENNLRSYAGLKLAGVKSVELAAKIEEFKKDPLALKLAGELVDMNADVNLIVGFAEKAPATGLTEDVAMGARIRVL